MDCSWDSASEDDDALDPIRQGLRDCIGGIKAAGSFACGRAIHEFPNPGLSVDGGEPIALPLSTEAARALGETLADEGVRTAWEIGADRISFRNPAWPGFVDSLVQRVAHELGVAPGADGKLGVRAELCKNILYGPGAKFEADNTEKAAGTFGTLAVCLPSQHTGGAVCLRHWGETVKLSTEPSSAWDCFCLAWYADVNHEAFCQHNAGRKDQAKMAHAQQWYIDRLVELLREKTPVGVADVSLLLDIISGRQIRQPTPEQRKVLNEAVIGFISKFTKAKHFVNILMVKYVLELKKPDSARLLFFHRILRLLLEPVISAFDLDVYHNLLRFEYPHAFPVFPHHGGTDNTRRTKAGPVRLFYDWVAVRNEYAAFRFLRRLQTQAPAAKKETINALVPPLVAELIPSVNTGSVEVQQCFRSLVETYVALGVGPEPPKPRDWVRPAEVRSTGCYQTSACDKCREINTFLEDPAAEQHAIVLGYDREHLRSRFYGFHYLQYEEAADNSTNKESRLTKTLKWWEDHHREWEAGAARATQALQDLPQDKIRELLGDQYDTLVALDCVRYNDDKDTDTDIAEESGAGL